MNRQKPSLIVFSVLYWMLVAFYFVMLRYSVADEHTPPGFHYSHVVAYGLVVGVLIGLLFGLFPLPQILRFKKRKSFLVAVLLGTCCYISFFIAVIFLTSLYGNTLSFASHYIFSGNGMVVLFHLSVSSLVYHFILQINKKSGPGMLLEYTLGKYFTPKVEERVFMFLDLRSSTSLAEQLGHISYSHMVQDCFTELTIPLSRYKAQVYQYIGDEVVLTWKINPGFSAANCYELFYSFVKRLNDKRDHFLREYGVYPEFKAGVHCGKVTVAEVGEVKTEIAYHGDVLNTASRIQGLCNRFQQNLLISESFLEQVSGQDRDRILFVAETALRGKETSTKVFAMADRPYTNAASPGTAIKAMNVHVLRESAIPISRS